MPHQTFFNLPDEKREQITQIAIKEFADHDYDAVSISRIVARAGIAKGSFYQYFAGKEDLYAYLLGLLVEAKSKFLSFDQPDPEHIGIFAYLRWMTEVGAAFQLAYPELTRMALRSANTAPYLKTFGGRAHELAVAFCRRLVDVGVQQGDIAPDVDRELAAVVVDAVLTGVGNYAIERLLKGHVASGQDDGAPADLSTVTDLFARAACILEHGLGRPSTTQGGE